MSDKNAAAAKWAVIDTNARAFKPNSTEIAPRTHEIGPGRVVDLYSDKATPLEEKYARLFLKDPSFIVLDEAGNQVKGLDEMQTLRAMPHEGLPNDRVIADLTELTDAALRTRCAVHPKFLDLPQSADRATMIDFLTGLFTASSTARARGHEDRLLGEDGSTGDSDPAEDARRVLEGA